MITSIMLRSIINFILRNKPQYIKKIRSSAEDSLILTLRCEEFDMNIYVSPKNSLFLPIYHVLHRKPLDPKYKKIKDIFEGSKIIKLYQLSLERIVIFNVKKRGSEYNVIIELFGKGNFILTDQDWHILYVMNPIKTKSRMIVSGERYRPPTLLSLDDILNQESYENKIKSVEDLYRFLPFDKYTVSYLINKLKIEGEVTREHVSKLISIIKELLEIAANAELICLVKVEEDKSILMPFKPDNYEILKCTNDFIELCTDYLNKYIIKATINREISDKIKKIELKIQNLMKQRSQILADLNKLESIIPKLYENAHIIENLLLAIKSGNYKQDLSLIEKIDERSKKVWIKVDNYTVSLRYDLGFHKAISELFNEIKRIKKGISSIDAKINSYNKLIKDIKTQGERQFEYQAWLIKRKRQWFEKFRWFYTSNHLLAIAGKDARSNELLIKRYLNHNDIVLHADIKGSPFTILKNGLTSAKESDIYEAAIFTASYSNAWKHGFSSIDVFWVKPEQVSKQAPSGEYLPRGSFMIYGKKNYLRGINLVLYVGMLKINGYPVIMIGPHSSIKGNNCTIIGELRPGSSPKGEIAKKIISQLESLLDRKLSKYDKEYLYNDLVERLPPGKSSLKLI